MHNHVKHYRVREEIQWSYFFLIVRAISVNTAIKTLISGCVLALAAAGRLTVTDTGSLSSFITHTVLFTLYMCQKIHMYPLTFLLGTHVRMDNINAHAFVIRCTLCHSTLGDVPVQCPQRPRCPIYHQKCCTISHSLARSEGFKLHE